MTWKNGTLDQRSIIGWNMAKGTLYLTLLALECLLKDVLYMLRALLASLLVVPIVLALLSKVALPEWYKSLWMWNLMHLNDGLKAQRG